MRERWWERYPARYDSELAELHRAGFRFAVDETAKGAGFLRIEVFPRVHDEEIAVVAVFPDLYPWFRFEVKAPNENLLHHQHPFAKILCMIPRATLWWRPETDRLAHFLTDRLSMVIESGRAERSADAGVEDQQGEPFSDYYAYIENSIVLVDGQWSASPDQRFGSAVLGVEGRGPVKPPPLLRGAILELADERGAVIYSAPREIHARFPSTLSARWSQLDGPPRLGRQDKVFEMLADGDKRAQMNTSHKVQGGRLTVRVGLFPEEHRWRGNPDTSIGQGWLVACRFDRDALAASQPGGRQAPRRNVTKAAAPQYYLARIGRAAPRDIVARAPELSSLGANTISIVGLGCIGAPSALEFSRAGIGELRIADHDFVDPATTVRWPRGLTAAGLSKAQVLDQIIAADYPYTKIRAFRQRLGDVTEGQLDNGALVEELLEDSHLVYDASAESAVQHFLAMEARRRAIPYIAVFGADGGWGGTLVRIRPQRTEGCWLCYEFGRAGGEIPAPPYERRAQPLQPEGCADPTFSGAGFDLAELALNGVRLAVSTLSAGVTDGYPETDWDVAVLSLRDENGLLIPPVWSTLPLRRHPQCPACAAND